MKLKPVTPTAKALAANFTRDAYVNPIYRGQGPSQLIVSLVRFAPGARTNRHSHAVGQTLRVTDGSGLVLTRDGTVIHMHPGDTVYTPPGEEHWHGAADGNSCLHRRGCPLNLGRVKTMSRQVRSRVGYQGGTGSIEDGVSSSRKAAREASQRTTNPKRRPPS